jgi:hypothetical protein
MTDVENLSQTGPSGFARGAGRVGACRNYAGSETEVCSPQWHRNMRMVRPLTESSICPTKRDAASQRGHRRTLAVPFTTVLSDSSRVSIFGSEAILRVWHRSKIMNVQFCSDLGLANI